MIFEHNFLVGIIIDEPSHLHDIHRRDKQGRPTFDRAMQGLLLLQKHGVEYNILVTVNRRLIFQYVSPTILMVVGWVMAV